MSTPQILNSNGQPARASKDTACPQCGAAAEKRIRTGFGASGFEFCDACGFAFGAVSLSSGSREGS